MAVRLLEAALLLEHPAEGVVGVVLGRRQLEQRPELGLRLVPALEAEVRDPERLADRGLVGLALLRLLEGDGGLCRHPLAEVGAALLKEVVRVAHVVLFRYGKFSSTKSSGSVKSRVLAISTAETAAPASIAAWNALPSS